MVSKSAPAQADQSRSQEHLYIYSSNIRTGHFEEFQQWIGENEGRFAEVQPKGWVLRGTYITAFGLGPAHVEVHWEIDSYQAFDIARSTAQRKGPWFELLTRFHSFLDPATGSGRVLKGLRRADTIVVGC